MFQLPNDIIRSVLKFLDTVQLLNFRLVCKSGRRIIDNSTDLVFDVGNFPVLPEYVKRNKIRCKWSWEELYRRPDINYLKFASLETDCFFDVENINLEELILEGDSFNLSWLKIPLIELENFTFVDGKMVSCSKHFNLFSRCLSFRKPLKEKYWGMLDYIDPETILSLSIRHGADQRLIDSRLLAYQKITCLDLQHVLNPNQLVKHFPLLNRLTLYSYSDLDFDQQDNILHLSLHFCKYPEELLLKFPRLKSLELEGCSTTKIIGDLVELSCDDTDLKISPDSSIEILISTACKILEGEFNGNFSELNLSDQGLVDKIAINSMKTLRSLLLDSVEIDSIVDLPILEYLNLQRCKINLLRISNPLSSLDLSSTIEKVEIGQVANALITRSRITELKLGDCQKLSYHFNHVDSISIGKVEDLTTDSQDLVGHFQNCRTIELINWKDSEVSIISDRLEELVSRCRSVTKFNLPKVRHLTIEQPAEIYSESAVKAYISGQEWKGFTYYLPSCQRLYFHRAALSAKCHFNSLVYLTLHNCKVEKSVALPSLRKAILDFCEVDCLEAFANCFSLKMDYCKYPKKQLKTLTRITHLTLTCCEIGNLEDLPQVYHLQVSRCRNDRGESLSINRVFEA